MLKLDQVGYDYPTLSIQTSFQVAQGQTAALMGPSGSGKSTILNLIAGFIAPHRGHISFNGASLGGLPPDQRPLTYLFQAHNLFPHLTVYENLALGLNPSLRMSTEQKMRISEALNWVSLTDLESRLPTDLSGGQQQRVGLARCLLRQKPILLLDEPFSALDQSLRNELTNLILDLQSQQSLSLVIATHQQQDADALGAQVVQVGNP